VTPPEQLDARRLVEEALRKSSALWLSLPAGPRIAWYVWLDGAACLVHEGIEQQLPGLADGGEVQMLVRSKDKGSLLVTVTAAVEPIEPGDDRWPATVAALHAHRQNPPDGPAQPARWAADSRVTRLVPRP
jgi:hypothetical protein